MGIKADFTKYFDNITPQEEYDLIELLIGDVIQKRNDKSFSFVSIYGDSSKARYMDKRREIHMRHTDKVLKEAKIYCKVTLIGK